MGKKHHGPANRLGRPLSSLTIQSPGVCVGTILEEHLDNFLVALLEGGMPGRLAVSRHPRRTRYGRLLS